jgi:hypothetical protein
MVKFTLPAAQRSAAVLAAALRAGNGIYNNL